MTHTIHPKMLEKVARSLAGAYWDTQNFLENPNNNKKRDKYLDKYWDRFETDAKAAIIAMWEGLPIEPSMIGDGKTYLLATDTTHCESADFNTWYAMAKLNEPCDHWTDGASLIHYNGERRGFKAIWKGFIPIPTQETEQND